MEDRPKPNYQIPIAIAATLVMVLTALIMVLATPDLLGIQHHIHK